MQPNDDLIRAWLWMQAMDFACNGIWRNCKNFAVPDERERLFMSLDDLIEKSYRYAFENWNETIRRISSSGSASGDGHFCTGCWINADSRGVIAEFRKRGLVAEITYMDVRHFINRLLEPLEMEERQMTMLEIMSMQS